MGIVIKRRTLCENITSVTRGDEWMSELYRPVRTFIIKMNDGDKLRYKYTNFKIQYGDFYEEVENYSNETFGRFMDRYYFYFSTYATTLKKQKYIVFNHNKDRIFIDNISTIDVETKSVKIDDTTTIKEIANELPYEDFLRFIYDKEYELKDYALQTLK